MPDWLIAFISVGLAELGDKTQLSIVVLASCVRMRALLLLGVLSAFAIVDGIAVLAGSWLVSTISLDLVRLLAGVMFIVFGILTFSTAGDENHVHAFKGVNPFVAGFITILMAEFGDKTQLAVGMLSTKFHPFNVFVGAMAALTLVSALAVLLGSQLAKFVHVRKLRLAAAVVFVLIGMSFLLEGLLFGR